jgi:hypothetical protein
MTRTEIAQNLRRLADRVERGEAWGDVLGTMLDLDSDVRQTRNAGELPAYLALREDVERVRGECTELDEEIAGHLDGVLARHPG